MFNKLAVGFIIFLVALIAIFDVFLAIKYGEIGTISYTIYASSQKWPIIPFSLGVLGGHLFWQLRNK